MNFLESALNLIWAAIALSTFALVLPRSVTSGRRLLPIAVALACTLLLLFPIISVTDDFSADRALAEEWNNGSRRIAAAAQQHHELPQLLIALAVVVLSIIAAMRVVALIETTSAPARLFVLTASSDPRSPPR